MRYRIGDTDHAPIRLEFLVTHETFIISRTMRKVVLVRVNHFRPATTDHENIPEPSCQRIGNAARTVCRRSRLQHATSTRVSRAPRTIRRRRCNLDSILGILRPDSGLSDPLGTRHRSRTRGTPNGFGSCPRVVCMLVGS
jgi:hypothetical protein